MNTKQINLYSDTQSLPSAAMRQAMAEAPVGDEQHGADPSVNRLCEKVAQLTGKQAAVFMPSGTMCNEIAIRVHCQAGDEIIADRSAHIINFEGGAPAVLSGVLINGLNGDKGIFNAGQVRAAIRPKNRYMPRTRLIEIEQTANLGGGTVWPLAAINEIAAVAREHELVMHMDGARLLNAVVASGIEAHAYAEPFDSVWIDLSKGLGCPVGAVLAGSQAFIDQAWYWKQRLGGAMRQAGIIAAAGIYALDHHIERLSEDHANAAFFAERIARFPGIDIDLSSVASNIVYFDVAATGLSGEQVRSALHKRGVEISVMGETRLRAVTHLDISRADVEQAADCLGEICTV